MILIKNDISKNSSDISLINSKLDQIAFQFDYVDSRLNNISLDIVKINNLLTSYKSLLDQNIYETSNNSIDIGKLNVRLSEIADEFIIVDNQLFSIRNEIFDINFELIS